MTIDLKTTPFSFKGSYLVISEVGKNWCGCINEPGLYLRTVHGSASMPLIARISIESKGESADYVPELKGAALALKCGKGKVEFCFDDPGTLLVRGGAGLEVTLDFMSDRGAFNYIYRFSRDGRDFEMANCFKNNCRCLMHVQKGTAALDQVWKEKGAVRTRLTLSGRDGFMLVLKEITTEWDGRWKEFDFRESASRAAENLAAFAGRMPSCPAKYKKTAEKAAYLLWASIVNKNGLLSRDAMMMSKNWMKNVWSWDHCFNAIALSYGAPQLAWDQFMLVFDRQDPTGLLPDSINDANMVWNFCKPPIHGWALRWMMKNMTLSDAQLKEAYARLSKWTKWWLEYRDYDGDGLCEYNHGNDSGWDNSTAFSVVPPIATPELQAFLVIQMDVLADLAGRLGKEKARAKWLKRSDGLLDRMLKNLFIDGLPTAVRSGSREIVPNRSLLPYVCIVLGERLPEDKRRRMIEVLSGNTFRGEHGFSTEAFKSPDYLSDGYWRGPIWAPSTMLITDGLFRCGETELARDTARRFADMVSTSGFAENFDAVTGAGLRDRAYTWTASAFLAMTNEYLLKNS
ncbi:MAG: glycogen debranching protein [Clostridiales bacterium]|nr:glycogen debranching protein [Clostridiales bacterium]